MKNILVVGGAGYIGSHCSKLLKKNGFMPIVLDDLSTGFEKNVKFGPFFKGDQSDKNLIHKIHLEYHIDAVMHFAAFAYVGESVSNPSKYYQNNFAKTLSLLDSIVELGINKIIFSSTCATYGQTNERLIDENHEQNPINPYGMSKYMVEQALKDYKKAYGLNYVAFRYFNAAGCDPDSEIGEDHNPETHLIPLILEAILDSNKTITVFGNDYDTPDGSCIRDYIHVNDISLAHINGLDLLEKGKSEFINLGNGNGFSVFEIIDKIKKVTGRNFKYKIGERRIGDPPILIGSNEKALKLLNWKPEFNTIETIIKTAWDYAKQKGE